MSVAKKILHFISTIFFYSVILLVILVCLMFLVTFIDKKNSLKNGNPHSPLFGAYVIISNSMIPHINVHDAVVTVRVDESKIHVDDIITFSSKEIKTDGTPITHRVIGIVYEDDSKEKIIGFRTKGDHNNTPDFVLIAPDEVIGKVFLRIPMLGYLQLFMQKPIGWMILILIPCLLIIGNDILKLIKSCNHKKILSEDLSSISPVSNIENEEQSVISTSEKIIENNTEVSTFPPSSIEKEEQFTSNQESDNNDSNIDII